MGQMCSDYSDGSNESFCAVGLDGSDKSNGSERLERLDALDRSK